LLVVYEPEPAQDRLRNPPEGTMTATALSASGTAKGALQRACLAVLERYQAAGELPTSARFVYYDLKQAGYPLAQHARRRDSQDVTDAVKVLRDTGKVPWEWISDETRSVEGPHLAASVRQWLLDVLGEARISLWDGQPRPVVVCESRGVRAALRGTAHRYGALATSTNGQVGGFLNTDVAPLLVPGSPVAYFGDHNPAGSAIEANARRVLEREVRGELDWQRLAVNPGQVADYNRAHPDRPLPPKPGTDRRFRDGHPHVSYEAEALGATELNRVLAAWLDDQLPEPLERVHEREAAESEQLRALLDGEAR
jgi:hypothetical protein